MTDKDITPQRDMTPAVESKNRYIAPQPPKKKGKLALILGIVAVAVIAAAVEVGLVVRDMHQPGAPTQTTGVATEEGTTEKVTTEDMTAEELITEHQHVERTIAKVEPTCTETGLTEGLQCDICKEILLEQEIISVIAHTYGDWVVDKQPEPGVEGNQYRICSMCSNIEGQTLDALYYSPGLEYYSNEDGTCRVMAIGTCTDTNIVFPAVYQGQTVASIEMTLPDYTTSVYIPSSVTQIHANMFYSCKHLTETENGVSYANGWALGVNPSFASITIREGTIGIAAFAFRENETLTSVSIPESVRYIGEGAFYICPQLKEINLPKNLSEIHSSAFFLCSSLTSITIPSNVISIREGAFTGCSALTEIVIPERVQTIEPDAFSACTNLKTLSVHPDNEMYHSTNNCIIETKAKILVAGCQTSRIPDDGSVTSIGNYAFWACVGLTAIAIPDNVTEIKGFAFGHCTGLTDVVVPDSVTRIERYAFVSCSNLVSIQLPPKLTNISENAFTECVSLQSISIPDNVTSISTYAFAECTGLTSVTLPRNLKSIWHGAFSGCSQLTHITIPSGTERIDTQAFERCYKIASVIIPDSVTSIRDGAFYGCTGLTDIYYTGTESEWKSITKATNWDIDTGSYTVHYNYVPN